MHWWCDSLSKRRIEASSPARDCGYSCTTGSTRQPEARTPQETTRFTDSNPSSALRHVNRQSFNALRYPARPPRHRPWQNNAFPPRQQGFTRADVDTCAVQLVSSTLLARCPSPRCACAVRRWLTSWCVCNCRYAKPYDFLTTSQAKPEAPFLHVSVVGDAGLSGHSWRSKLCNAGIIRWKRNLHDMGEVSGPGRDIEVPDLHVACRNVCLDRASGMAIPSSAPGCSPSKS